MAYSKLTLCYTDKIRVRSVALDSSISLMTGAAATPPSHLFNRGISVWVDLWVSFALWDGEKVHQVGDVELDCILVTDVQTVGGVFLETTPSVVLSHCRHLRHVCSAIPWA